MAWSIKRVYKKGCQENTSLSTGRRFSRHPAPSQLWCPCNGSALFHLSRIFFSSDDASRFLKLIKPCGCTVSTMGLSEARGLVLFRVIRGGIGGYTETGCPQAPCRLQAIGILTLEPERLQNRPTTTRKRSPEMEGALHRRRSSGLRFQFFGVEALSLLPKSQRNRCNLAR